LGSLKQKIDQYLARQRCIEELVAQAQEFLLRREEKLVNARKHALEELNSNISFSNPNMSSGNSISHNSSRRSSLVSDPFSRGTVFCSEDSAVSFAYMLRKPDDNFLSGVETALTYCELSYWTRNICVL
jgi:hypothetical protein